MSDKQRTYEANAALNDSLHLQAVPAKEKQTASRQGSSQRRKKGFSPELIQRIIEQIREL